MLTCWFYAQVRHLGNALDQTQADQQYPRPVQEPLRSVSRREEEGESVDSSKCNENSRYKGLAGVELCLVIAGK